MELIDFKMQKFLDDYEYGGAAGMKQAIEYNGCIWMLKFPKSTRDFNNAGLSYTTAPLNEFLGSQIYGTLDIPVHDTLLGIKNGHIVVACKDFVAGQGRLIDFLTIRNSILPDSNDFYSSDISGNSTKLTDILCALNRTAYTPRYSSIASSLYDRFWDMFVVDAFIRNNDRNNGNWGVLKRSGDNVYELAPVYDNGGSFFSTRRGSQNALRAVDNQAVLQDAFGCFSIFEYDDGHRIEPYSFMAKHEYPECDAAIARFMERCDMGKVEAIINDVPEQWNGQDIMPSGTKDLYKAILHTHYNTFTAISEGRELTKSLKRELVHTVEPLKLQDVARSAKALSDVMCEGRNRDIISNEPSL